MKNTLKKNQVWLALRINDLFPPSMANDIYVLMDINSGYLFGNLLLNTVNIAPKEENIEALFRSARQMVKKWPDKLIMPEHSIAENAFLTIAEKNGISFGTSPLSDLSKIVAPLKQTFSSIFG